MSLAPFSRVSPTDTYSDLDVSRGVDLDTTRPEFEGLDESHRPSVDSIIVYHFLSYFKLNFVSVDPIYEEEMPPVQQHSTTYDELRKKNREEYQARRTGVFKLDK